MDVREIAAKLKAPFPAADIDWRVQRAMVTKNGNKAIVLAYITSRAVQERLDEVFGINGWRDEYERWGEKGVKCGISCYIDGQWVTKWDGADETAIEPTKGGISDAFKRAAVKWGIGRYLYDLPESWVDIKDSGTYYVSTEVKSGGQKVQIKGYWDPPQLPEWALPEGERRQKKAPPPEPPTAMAKRGFPTRMTPPGVDLGERLKAAVGASTPKDVAAKAGVALTSVVKAMSDVDIPEEDRRKIAAFLEGGAASEAPQQASLV